MRHRYLEVSFRDGKPLAAYLYLPRNPGDTSSRTQRGEAGLLIDYAEDGRVTGIEITAPRKITLEALNQVLSSVNQDPVTPDDLAPLAAA
jgi:uncharacterized protein YuzE